MCHLKSFRLWYPSNYVIRLPALCLNLSTIVNFFNITIILLLTYSEFCLYTYPTYLVWIEQVLFIFFWTKKPLKLHYFYLYTELYYNLFINLTLEHFINIHNSVKIKQKCTKIAFCQNRTSQMIILPYGITINKVCPTPNCKHGIHRGPLSVVQNWN